MDGAALPWQSASTTQWTCGLPKGLRIVGGFGTVGWSYFDIQYFVHFVQQFQWTESSKVLPNIVTGVGAP